jgi:hypothetical protein
MKIRNLTNFAKTLKQSKTKHVVGINRRVGYDMPMPFLEPVETSKSFDTVRITGSEFITTVSVKTTDFTTPTQPGDVIYNLPISPTFMPGTRLSQLAKLYQKYRYTNLVFEYVPIVPSIQDGAILMYIVEDPNENPSLITDPDTRLRNDMAHKGAHMFNVYTYGRTFLTKGNDSYNWYFIYNDDEPRLNNQGQFFIVASSLFTNENTSLTLGQIIMHYDIEFTARTMNDNMPGPRYIDYEIVNFFEDHFVNFQQGEPYAFVSSTNLPGIENMVYVIRCTRELLVGGSPVSCNTELEDGIQFFSQGSVWYATCKATNTHMEIYPTLDDALTGNQPATLAANITAAAPVTGHVYVSLYPRDINFN